MKEPIKNKSSEFEKRSESRTVLSSDQYSMVEFSLDGLAPAYIFKVRDISSSGLGILVNKDSAILQRIQVGDVLTLTYTPADAAKGPENLRTQIRHITKDDERFKGDVLMGLFILKGQENVELS